MNRYISLLERQCLNKGMRMTEQRRIIAYVLSKSKDHPDVEELYKRSSKIDDRISIATIYRTVRLFEEAGILERHDFKNSRSCYETISKFHHDHLIDINSGQVLEFRNKEIECLQQKIAKELGYNLIDHRMELYAIPIRK